MVARAVIKKVIFMKAYWVGGDIGECADLIFAKSVSKAKGLSVRIGLATIDLEYTEINAFRAPDADKFLDPEKTEAYSIDLSTIDNVEIWREAGGHDESGSCDSCGRCGFAELPETWTKPEWYICADCNQCGECGCDCEK